MKSEKISTLVKTLPLLSSLVLGVALQACAPKLAGSYNLSTTESGGSYLMSNCQTSASTMSVTENGNSVTGSTANTCFSESFTGTESGGTISNVTLTLIPTTQLEGGSVSSSCLYTGNLTVQNNQLTGILALESGGTTYGYGYNSVSACPNSLSMNGTQLD